MSHLKSLAPPSLKEARPIWQQTGRGLGSEIKIALVGRLGMDRPDEAFATVWRQIQAFEVRFSRFQPESELSQLNRSAGDWMIVSRELSQLLSRCRDLNIRTKGIFNPAVLPALAAAGYDRSFDLLESDEARFTTAAPEAVVDFSAVELDGQNVKLPTGCQIDLGGIGKGYLLDQLADTLAMDWSDFWVSLGGDLVAVGCDPTGQPWPIEITDAHTGLVADQIKLADEQRWAVATSGVVQRRGTRRGKPWHHLIDPRTGAPAVTDTATATVAGPWATEADVLAKCVVIAGSDILEEEQWREYKLLNWQS